MIRNCSEAAIFHSYLIMGPANLTVLKTTYYILVAVGSSGILKGKQKLGVTFNSNKLGVIDFTKFSKLTGPIRAYNS